MMTRPYSTTGIERGRSGRKIVETLVDAGWHPVEIARACGKAPNTIRLLLTEPDRGISQGLHDSVYALVGQPAPTHRRKHRRTRPATTSPAPEHKPEPLPRMLTVYQTIRTALDSLTAPERMAMLHIMADEIARGITREGGQR
jgi:hypothetical protein